MASGPSRSKLIVIVGPTASGKSELAIRIAQQYDGEIISADSRTIYMGMDIGTAKPSHKDQAKIRHWGLDLIEVDQKFSAKQFQQYASLIINDIRQRAKMPILVGGTGLYIDSVIFDYDFDSSWERDPINPRHSLKKGSSKPGVSRETLLIGLDPGKKELDRRIQVRAAKIVGPDFINEVRQLIQKRGVDLEAFTATSYRPFISYLKGEVSLEEAQKKFIQNDLKLAKKQRTWFKRNKFILWHADINSAEHTIKKTLNT